MKIYQKKNLSLRLAVILTMLFVFAQFSAAQQLKPTEIIYSRLPTDLSQPPVGANSPTIWAVGQDGANDRQITTGMAPRISDDGRFLLFRRLTCTTQNFPYCYNPYASQPTARLFVRDLQNNTETMILNYENQSNRLIGYYFSPESNRGDYQIILDYGSLLYKMNLDGTGRIALEYYFGTGFPREGDYFPVLRRGDSRIAMATSRGCNFGNTGCQIVTRTLGTELPENVPNTGEGDNNPSWSNDNQFIGFATIDASRNYIFESSYYPYFFRRISKIKPDGTGKTQLFDMNATSQNGNGIAFGTIWTEDNSKIIAAARIGGVAGLYAFNTDGSGTYTRIPIANGNAPDFVGGIVQPREEQQVVSIGGGVAANGNYSLIDTIGEVVAGQNSSGGSYSFDSGFWANAAALNKTLFDFDGDGKADVSVFRPSSGIWYLLQSNNGFTGAAFGQSGDKITPADYDGDGKTDIAVYRSGIWYLQRSALGFTGIAFGDANDVPVPGDYDRDGKADVAVFRPSTGVWYLLRSSLGFTGIQFGAATDKPVPADYDGDGETDVAVYRGGVWYIQRSTLGFTGITFGIASDTPVAADYDGDGKADQAVYRGGTWYLLQSAAGFTGVQFGVASDIPAAADYDGDGKTDIAVFRSGTWYLQRSTAGFTGVAFGDGNDKPVPSAFVP